MNRGRLAILLAAAALLTAGVFLVIRGGSDRRRIARSAKDPSTQGLKSKPAPQASKIAAVPLTPSAASKSQACREVVGRGLRYRGMRPGLIAHSLSHFHRGNREFREMADAFCRQAGDDLVPICRNLLAELESEASSALVAAILGHSRRADAFDLLKELVRKGQGPPSSPELHASAVYSMGMIDTPDRIPYLLNLFRSDPVAAANVYSKFGTPLMAAIGMCGREGVAVLREAALNHLNPEIQVEPGEGLRAFRWSYLGQVSSPEAFGDLKSIAEKDADLRLRGMAIAAIGQSPDLAQRGYLAELYGRDENPLVKRAILEALHEARDLDDWVSIRSQLSGPLNAILKGTKIPSGDPELDFAAVRLASVAGTPESAAFVNDWIRAGNTGAFGGAQLEWASIAIHALAAQGEAFDRFDALINAEGVTRQDRIYYLSSMQNQSPVPIGGMDVAREMIGYVDSAPALDGSVLNSLTALARMPEARLELEASIDRLLQREQGARRLHVLNSAYMAGEAALGPLEKVIVASPELPEVLHASQSLLQALPQGATLGAQTDERIKSLFSSRALDSFNAGVLGPYAQSPGSFARTVGLYFGRFGTEQDVAWLETLPRLMNNVRGLREDQLASFRQELAWECARAADAIRLRSR